MSERPTPETDAAEYLISIGRKNDEWVVRSDVSRKLERELAEAREYGVRMEAIWNSEVQRRFCDVDGLQAKINLLTKERDEAREMAQQLIHIASHCLGWNDNTNPETIADAINRWNASTKK